MDWNRTTPKSNKRLLDPDFYERLCALEKLCGFELVINSAYRSVDYEISKGRKGTSSHCKGVAIDIRVADSIQRLILVRSAFLLGFERIGIYENFVHIDADNTKVSCMWFGK